MTYKRYIKKDYKIKNGKVTIHRPFMEKHHFPYLFISVSVLTGILFYNTSNLRTPASVIVTEERSLVVDAKNDPPSSTLAVISTAEDSNENYTKPTDPPSKELFMSETTVEGGEILLSNEAKKTPYWESVKVQSGDNLALIFKRKRLSPKMLYNIMALGEDAAVLKHIKPGQEIRFLFEDGEFEAMQYDVDLTDTLYIKKLGNLYSADLLEKELEVKIKTVSGTINDSLFLSGKRAGLSDNMIMQMINLYAWDIDFAMEIRQGDKFHVIYEERYKDNNKIQDGPILAAKFINRGKSFTAVLYTYADGHSDYYAANGHSMRKAFLRTPVKFTRISSRFSLGRRHPILNKIRAHKGVDYAAPTGTLVRAAGDGVIKIAAIKGGYGRTITIQHGGKYTTLYGHLSRYGRGIKTGKHVKQGQIIAYVGMSGLATGPHLHYEFRVNGVHRNPLTVKLPKAIRIPDDLMAAFKIQTKPLLAQLNHITDHATIIADRDPSPPAIVQPTVAMNEEADSSSPTN